MQIRVKKVKTPIRKYEVIRKDGNGKYQVELRAPRVIKHSGQF